MASTVQGWLWSLDVQLRIVSKPLLWEVRFKGGISPPLSTCTTGSSSSFNWQRLILRKVVFVLLSKSKASFRMWTWSFVTPVLLVRLPIRDRVENLTRVPGFLPKFEESPLIPIFVWERINTASKPTLRNAEIDIVIVNNNFIVFSIFVKNGTKLNGKNDYLILNWKCSPIESWDVDLTQFFKKLNETTCQILAGIAISIERT